MHIILTHIKNANLDAVKAVLMENEFCLDALFQEKDSKGRTPQAFAAKRLEMARSAVELLEESECTDSELINARAKVESLEKIVFFLNRAALLPKPQVTRYQVTTYSAADAIARINAAHELRQQNLAQQTAHQLELVAEEMSNSI